MAALSKFEKVKGFYEKGLWSISRVRDSVEKEWITPEQFFEITGEEYEQEG
jgi:hypothetical protein